MTQDKPRTYIPAITRPDPPIQRLPIGVDYRTQPDSARCSYYDATGHRCWRNAHSFGAHVTQ
jgi:hypothetical protein